MTSPTVWRERLKEPHVPGPECFPVLAAGPLAYVGLGPGMEFFSFFLALLAWVGAALLAVLQWPLSRLLRRLWRAKGAATGEPGSVPSAAGSQDKP
jgi:hypothetical protein